MLKTGGEQIIRVGTVLIIELFSLNEKKMNAICISYVLDFWF
jgi:hypothetical protein